MCALGAFRLRRIPAVSTRKPLHSLGEWLLLYGYTMNDLLICIDRKDFPAAIPHKFYLPESSPVVCCGPVEILQGKRVTILNSRQSPRLHKDSAWALNTIKALRNLDPKETTLVTSLGTIAWDFLTWTGGKLRFKIILVFPGGSAQNFKLSRTRAIMDLGLDDRMTLAIRPLVLKSYKKKSEVNALRDQWIVSLSHTIMPLSVRTGGNLDTYLNSAQLKTTAVCRDYAIQYEKLHQERKPSLPKKIVTPEWYKTNDFLIHWTRSCVGPWPDESRAEHFERVVASGDSGLSGLDTLRRIIKEGVIRASSRLIRDKYEVVPFTETLPQELPDLIRWRAGLRRWTFEPYGIALARSKLLEIRAKPVIYGDIRDYEAMSEEDKPFFQVAGTGKRDWKKEREWRVQGDVKLSLFGKNEAVYIVNNIDAVQSLRELNTHQVLSLSPHE